MPLTRGTVILRVLFGYQALAASLADGLVVSPGCGS